MVDFGDEDVKAAQGRKQRRIYLEEYLLYCVLGVAKARSWYNVAQLWSPGTIRLTYPILS